MKWPVYALAIVAWYCAYQSWLAGEPTTYLRWGLVLMTVMNVLVVTFV